MQNYYNIIHQDGFSDIKALGLYSVLEGVKCGYAVFTVDSHVFLKLSTWL